MSAAVATPDPDAHGAATALVGSSDLALTRIGGGRNSRVYRVETGGGTAFVLKLYFRNPADPRDRRAVEYQGLRFVRANGIGCVPAPLVTDADQGATLFEFVRGEPALAAPATDADLDALAGLLVALRGLCGRPGAFDLPPASDANFALAAVPKSIEVRLHRLREVGTPTRDHADLRRFLDERFAPTLAATVAWADAVLGDHGLGLGVEIPVAARTLSPSDVGFHNAVRRPDGSLAFVDFEYFGWDDPAKTAADLLLHPGMPLTDPQRGRLLGGLLGGFGPDHGLAARVRVAYPLYALKWCTILLNEFVPENLERRVFADPRLVPTEVRRVQLAKAEAMLARAAAARVAFPYENWVPT